jgi:hypothetical protein
MYLPRIPNLLETGPRCPKVGGIGFTGCQRERPKIGKFLI